MLYVFSKSVPYFVAANCKNTQTRACIGRYEKNYTNNV